MVTYSIKDIMSRCSGSAFDAQIQKKIFFSRFMSTTGSSSKLVTSFSIPFIQEVHVDIVGQQRYATAAFTDFNCTR